MIGTAAVRYYDPPRKSSLVRTPGWGFNRLGQILGLVFGPLFGLILGPFFVLLNKEQTYSSENDPKGGLKCPRQEFYA